MRWNWLIAVLMIAAVQAGAARAEWWEVRTDHFQLTIDESEEKARDFGRQLELYDSALRTLYGVDDEVDEHVRPLQIIELRATMFSDVCRCGDVLGYYLQRSDRSALIGVYLPDMDRKAKVGGWSSQIVLFHEYAHHFSFHAFPLAYPFWFQEGFAEFNATAHSDDGNSVEIGFPANYRAEEARSDEISPRELFAPERFAPGWKRPIIYGRGWLLTHYLMLEPKRKDQLSAYLDRINGGTDSLQAAQESFGDLKALDRELNAYAKKGMHTIKVTPPKKVIRLSARRLTAAEAMMLPVYAQYMGGVADGHRKGLAIRASNVAHRFPDSATVQERSAEINFYASRLAQAEEGADAALRLNPGAVGAMVVKGLVAMARLQSAQTRDPAPWAAARNWFLKANHLDPNAVAPLLLYYRSFAIAKQTPSSGAVSGLMRAYVLAPESRAVRAVLARQLIEGGKFAEARAILQPLANEPHAKIEKNRYSDAVAFIDAAKTSEAKLTLDQAIAERDKREGPF